MTRHCSSPWWTLLWGLLFCIGAGMAGWAQIGTSNAFRNGTFLPTKNGTSFAWQISATNALFWNGKPYLPVGVAFRPLSLEKQDAGAWPADENFLNALKAKGIHDVLVSPSISLTQVNLSALQRLVDALDAGGFRYGLAFGKGMDRPITGFEVRPAIYRFDDPNKNVAIWQVNHTNSAAFFVVDAAADSRLVGFGMATVNGDIASVPLDAYHNIPHPVTLLLPLQTLQPDERGVQLPDIWSGLDSYRDSLLAMLRQIHFGPGLRFFLDPLGPQVGLSDEGLFLVPNSELFRLAWESYLDRKYGSPDAVVTKWQISKSFSSMGELAQLVPLWSLGRGFPYMYDPSNGQTYRVSQPSLSTWWDDFSDCRAQALHNAVETIDRALQRYVADVPIVESGGLQSIGTLQLEGGSGPEGLAAAFSAQNPPSLEHTLAPLYSMASLSQPPRWLIAVPSEPAEPYGSFASLDGQVTSMLNLGFKGFFFSGISPDHLDWVVRIAQDVLDSSAMAMRTPHVLYYPLEAPGPAFTGQVPGDSLVYWIPAPLHGSLDDWWPSVSGYTIQLPSGPETVLTSLLGPRLVRLQVPDPRVARAYLPDGSSVPVKVVGKNLIEVRFGFTPLVFTGVGESPIPLEAASDALALLSLQLPKASKADRALAEVQRDQAEALERRRDYLGAYTAVRPAIEGLAADEAPYLWMEGENAALDNFTENAHNAGASGGAYLRLSTPEEPTQIIKEYAARYTFLITTTGDYDIWLAGTVPGPDTSPFTWYLDHQPPQPPASTTPSGPRYLSGYFGWIYLGRVSLGSGDHAVSFKVAEPAPHTRLYTFSIDMVVVAPASFSFHPNTTMRPLPLDAQEADKFLRMIGVQQRKK